MAIREGRWDCLQCNSIGQLGRHHKCQSCGAPRPIGTKFYQPEDAPAVTDANLLKQAGSGADKLCGYCNAMILATQTACPNCGASLEDALRERERLYGVGQVPRSSGLEPEAAAPRDFPSSESPSRTSYEPDDSDTPVRHPYRKKALIAGAIAAVGLLSWAVLHTREVPVTVQALSWERTIEVQDERTVIEEDWSVPAGGRQKSSRREIHHYDHVVDHYVTRSKEVCESVQTGTETYSCGSRDLGNGFFEDKTCSRPTYGTKCHNESYQDAVYRDDPVYATKYRYEIERWFTNRTERAAGNDNIPNWPPYRLGVRERVGPRAEHYKAVFQGPKRTHEYSVPLTVLQELRRGKQCVGRINIFGAILAQPVCK